VVKRVGEQDRSRRGAAAAVVAEPRRDPGRQGVSARSSSATWPTRPDRPGYGGSAVVALW
jgi:hypothetical protein